LNWLRFGYDCLLFAGDPKDASRLDDLKASDDGWRVELNDTPHAAELLYLVTQEGRSFQEVHPDAAVLLDKGRHLVVALDPRQSITIVSRPARFSIHPVTQSETVVERVERPAVPQRADPRIKSIVDAVSRDGFGTVVTELASLPTRHSLTRHFRDAADQLSDQLRQLGYQVAQQRLAIEGGETLNVIADKRGSGAGERSVTLVTAHLDSVNGPSPPPPQDPAAPAPGADDNASGSAGVMEIARVLKDTVGTQDLRLVLFGGEEQGLLGSKHFVSTLTSDQKSRIKSVVNMDMIAVVNRRAPGPSVLLEGQRVLSEPMMAKLTSAAHTYTNLVVDHALNPHDSDHVPFIRANVPAVLTIEGSDKGNTEIHSANDTLARLNHDLAVEILRMNTAYVAQEIEV